MLEELQNHKIMIVEDNAVHRSESMRMQLNRLESALKSRRISVVRSYSYGDALPLALNDMDLDCFLVAADMDMERRSSSGALELLSAIRERQRDVPLFWLADREKTAEVLASEMLKFSSELVWIFEDSTEFIAGRICAAISRYRQNLLPPLMKAIWLYNEKLHEYSYAAPGHQGGIGFTKSPAGKKFYDFYGENLFRTDTGIERSSIGSLLDHSGAFAECEKLMAKTFGADESYSVVTGTSGSNRTIMQAMLAPGSVALCDRNCHKSIEQGLIISGATPVYMLPSRNVYGIIGPVPRSEMTAESVNAKLKSVASKFDVSRGVQYAVLTNCTYDGLCYNTVKTEGELSKSSDVIHFDEAWYAYARFNRMYENHYAMRGERSRHSGATVFATHSTHKLLAALSQASAIHIRQGRKYIDFGCFNQAYMMHSTTSPLYAICASNDIAVKMMHDNGPALTQEVIDEAVDFRQALARLYRSYTGKGSWFFKPWNAESVFDSSSGNCYDFADAPRELLRRDQKCWQLEPGAAWHGFEHLEENYAMLDPIKVSILTPGLSPDGTYSNSGVPAMLAAAYLSTLGIVPTRTTDFQLMFLFSMGITKGKWSTLLNALIKFKELYDNDAPLEDVLPEIASAYPDKYRAMGLRELGIRMFDYLKREQPGKALNDAYSSLPEPVMTPREAYLEMVSGNVENVSIDHLYGRVAAAGLIPYPPGIPIIMSGENFGSANSPVIAYLKTLQQWNQAFPGFDHITEGLSVSNGKGYVMCVKK